jgi:hypothetical protein
MYASLRYSFEMWSSLSFQGDLCHGLTSLLLIFFSAIVTTQNTQQLFARSPAEGFVQEIILAASSAAPHAATACFLSQAYNFPVAM